MKKINFLYLSVLIPILGWSQSVEKSTQYDISKDRVLYTVGYSHLDSQYEWDYKTTVSEYLKNTMEENFRLFEKYPHYVFNFTGSRRYKLMNEYHPELFKKLQAYIDQERWFVAGSNVDEGEVNVSSSESVIRQVLYSNNYFRKEFGKESKDYMLPDCFGFVASLPSVLHHTGLLGFSTQKLTIPNLDTAIPLPFNIGVWNGPDGKGLISVLDATDYDGDILPRLDIDPYWVDRLNKDRDKYGILFGYRYYGAGDMGGGIRERDLINAEGSLNNPDSKLKVELTSSDQMFKDITPEIEKELPVFSGDLFLVEHSAGSQSSQSYMKRLNRKNEVLAQAAEQMASMAGYLTNTVYPLEKLNNSWELVLSSQMHDILPGTAIPSAYNLSWNDEFIAQNGFTEVLKNSIGQASSQLNTNSKGRAVTIYNPVARDREDICTAELEYNKMPVYVKVYNTKGKEVPSQVIFRKGNKLKVIFIAQIKSLGLAVYDVRNSSTPSNLKTKSLAVQSNSLENEYYKITLNEKGDIGSIFDKKINMEILSKPARLEFLHEKPKKEPSWNMFWYDRKNPAFAFMNEDVSLKIVESGPVRIALQISRKGQNSGIDQIISLSAGKAGKRIEVANKIDWQSTGVSLKASFPFTATNENATYNLGVGTVERNTNHEKKFEVPSKMWLDLTDRSGAYGVSILEDCKYGSDKPDNNTLRLTLQYTPSAEKCPTWLYQASQDWGIQDVKYGLYSHSGDWSTSETQWQAQFLNNPLLAFESPKHSGKLGKEFSFLSISSPKIGLMALKKAEKGDYIIIRVNELAGKDQRSVKIKFPCNIQDAYEVNGQEQKTGNANFSGNSLQFDCSHHSLKSFAVKLAPKKQVPFNQTEVVLPYDEDVMSFDTYRMDGNFTSRRVDPIYHWNVETYPAEMIPKELISEGVKFKLGATEDLKNNVVNCKGQDLKLPSGDYNKVYILAAATEDTSGDFLIHGKANNIKIAKWHGFIGQHYDRQFLLDGSTVYDVKAPFLKYDNIAWFASHYHFGYPTANVPYAYSYIFKYEIDLENKADKITLPDNSKIKIFAITVAKNMGDKIQLLQPLSDDFSENKPFQLRNKTD